MNNFGADNEPAYQPLHQTGKEQKPKLAVLLTGSTGSVGTYLLDKLLALPGIERVVCLVRSEDGRQRQEDALKARGLEPLPPCGVDFFKADLSKPQFDLSDSLYGELLGTVSAVLHNGWPVDFNLSYASFEPAILGVENMIRFCYECRYLCPLFFISSISVAGNWGAVPGSQQTIPEIQLDDWRLARTGYGQSKLVAETLICEASRISALPVSICRVGQLAGPVKHGTMGYWNEKEWVPRLLSSCQKLGALPATLGPADMLDWVPIDVFAQAAVELFEVSARASVPGPSQHRFRIRSRTPATSCNIYHLSNPQQVSWTSLMPVIQYHLGGELQLVSLPAWVDLLKSKANLSEASEIEGLKLWDFFDNLRDRAIRFPRARAAMLETKYTRKLSPTLDGLGALNAEWMDLWLRQWKKAGILD